MRKPGVGVRIVPPSSSPACVPDLDAKETVLNDRSSGNGHGNAEVDELMEPVVRRVHDRLPAAQAPLVEDFVRHYYRDVDAGDLADRAADDLYGAALSHWHFARSFAGGRPKLRVFNPRVDEHGWQSTHTVVEIVNDDMPFLVDSITMEVNRQGLTLHLIVHPVMKVQRDAQHHLAALLPPQGSEPGRYESLIHVEVDRRSDPAQLQALHDGLLAILDDVRAAVEDWQPMRQALLDAVAQVESRPPPVAPDELAEDLAFLRWLAADNFTLLGQRDYALVDDGGNDSLQALPGSGLGILRGGAGAEAASASFAALPPEVRARAREPRVLLLTKANSRSTVHRPGHLDYVGVKRFDDAGQVVGERRFLGLFTSIAYNAKAADIPLLRRKLAAVTQRAGFLPRSHKAKALATILEQFPRDELFQIEPDDLHRIAMGILRLGERQRTRLFVHRDAYGRFTSCLVYVPRENYNTEVRARMQALLTEALGGESSEFSVQFSDSPLARVLIVVRTPAGQARAVDVQELEQRIVRATRRWEDELRDVLVGACGEERGNALHVRYARGFSPGYRHDHGPREAVRDIEMMESLADNCDAMALALYRPLEAAADRLHFRLVRCGELAPLSQSMPMLEHMGVQVLEERPYEVRRSDGSELWIDDFGLAVPGGEEIDVDALRERFLETFRRVWAGDNESDPLNRLVLLAGLDWRGVSLMRACMRYVKQGGFALSRAYIQQTLAAYPAITAALVALFQARFDPDFDGEGGADRDAAQAAIGARIEAALEDVANLDEDRILRQLLALIRATLRTNFFQRGADGGFKPVIAFKIDPAKVPGLPAPRPRFEIFVSSPRVEGVHLRFGRVARGGLRWSDRLEDYRTEVLGLVKAQQVKNTIIVPVGSKGGFVVRNPPAGGDREALLAEGVACYRAYLRGLLDVTDNLDGGRVAAPPRVVRHDDDDPYLVVAADKGTATFSDIANQTAAEYGFWLGDAFASGGSAGYDHKKMGITARGAWESVKHHFRSLGHDTQSQDFTVAGVGDMSGDVFGNGMLLSRHIRLVAAFDHRHIFVDPDPDAARSYVERERMFALARSSWADYDRALISAGGGVWPRSAKAIPISDEMRRALGLADEVRTLTPAELVHAILKAPVDLLYNGGIGTYVKASDQSHAECGDRANDAVRVDGRALRCKVVAEGGNLGCTQRGRIEFALAGGLINTDAIDNSAGVDCSDHEVNIKILLDAVVREGELTPRQRDRLLAEMTEDVAALCLRDNVFQNQVLGVTRMRGLELLDEQMRSMRHLVASGRLDRALENLPDDEALAERARGGSGLTTPELAVLLAYAKMELYDFVLASDVPEDAYIATSLARYFPERLAQRYPQQMQRHPLRREIVATHVVNSMVNRVGPTFVHRLSEETGAAAADIVRAYMSTREVFQLVSLWQANDALGTEVDQATRHRNVLASLQLLERATVWMLQHPGALRDLDATIRRYGPGAAEVGVGLERWLVDEERRALQAQEAALVAQGVPGTLAQRVTRLDAQFSALDIVEVGEAHALPIDTVAGVYFGLGGALQLGWVGEQVVALPVQGHWQGLARLAMRNDLSALARELAASVLAGAGPVREPQELIGRWQGQREHQLARCRQLLADLRPLAPLDASMLSVLLRELRALV